MFLLMPHRNSRQMRVVRLDAQANKRKIADTFLLAPLSCVALANDIHKRELFLRLAVDLRTMARDIETVIAARPIPK
jgi:hypothetical protein